MNNQSLPMTIPNDNSFISFHLMLKSAMLRLYNRNNAFDRIQWSVCFLLRFTLVKSIIFIVSSYIAWAVNFILTFQIAYYNFVSYSFWSRACDSTTRFVCLFVRWLVGCLVGRSVTFYFFYDFISLTPLLMPKWFSNLKHGPCPPIRDFGSSVSALFYLKVKLY